jgi:hypothetical protein
MVGTGFSYLIRLPVIAFNGTSPCLFWEWCGSHPIVCAQCKTADVLDVGEGYVCVIVLGRKWRRMEDVKVKVSAQMKTQNRRRIKGKAVPLQAWGGPEGSRKLRCPDFLIAAQDGGKVVSLMHRPHFPPGKTPGTLFC